MFEPLIVAAVDFGTHGTGFAWTIIEPKNADPENRVINFCNRWPAQPVACAKNLSALLINQNGDVAAWGFDARKKRLMMRNEELADYQFVSGFKMDIFTDPGATLRGSGSGETVPDAEAYLPDDESMRVNSNRYHPSFNFIVAYLRQVYECAIDQISASGYNEDDIRWCLTVPAIWTDYQKQVMRDAAKNAGFPTEDDRLLLAYEPEAAAHHARVSKVRITRGSTKADLRTPGERFMVVDCGGGTVDITAYENDAKGMMNEIARANGGRLGSNYINQAFQETLLTARFGSHEIVEEMRQQQSVAFLELLDAWERAKLHVTADQDDHVYLTLPAAIDRFIDDATRQRLSRLQNGVSDAIAISPSELRSLFESVVPGILNLIDKQLLEMTVNSGSKQKAPPTVLLVGGFGNSPYLQEAARVHLAGKAEVLIPPDPNVAVLFGAVHFCYEPHTRARRARWTYGVQTSSRFEKGIDPEDLRFTGDLDQELCANRFSVFVNNGDIVPSGREANRRYIPAYATQEALSIPLFVCDSREPRYVTDEGCLEVGKITLNLKKVMRFALEDRGVRVYMKFGETEVGVRAVVEKSGEEVSTTVDFHSDY
ncbi:Hsp70 family protein [Streptomyces qinzhouensis]|uniref:Hsp70 family protein n=1 Tax=Streptomyces qinzhouensis TaxID=2599401 RepID=A0A5B8JGY5_9ACTN|nr:Hsp70 family protein [Streptomyces qinzhouensis]QDY79554.1 Hsp70 family protein [Streptomyces qinzhouensis]